MKLVRFNAPAHHRLVAFGDTILGGQTVEMSDAEAARLATDPHVNVTVSDPEPGGEDKDGTVHSTQEELEDEPTSQPSDQEET